MENENLLCVGVGWGGGISIKSYCSHGSNIPSSLPSSNSGKQWEVLPTLKGRGLYRTWLWRQPQCLSTRSYVISHSVLLWLYPLPLSLFPTMLQKDWPPCCYLSQNANWHFRAFMFTLFAGGKALSEEINPYEWQVYCIYVCPWI